MVSKRGSKNMDAYNARRKEVYLTKISEALDTARKKKLKFETVERLSGHVEKTSGIRRSNLMRNSDYRAKLEDYIREGFSQQNNVALVEPEKVPTEVLRVQNLALELENSNLKEKVKQYEASEMRRKTKLLSGKALPPSVGEDYRAFVDTAMALATVLYRQREIMKLNPDTQCIEEIGGRPSERLIVGAQRLGPFIKWRQENDEFLTQVMPGTLI